MIAIVNVSKKPAPRGWQDYEVRINSEVIASFRHKREDGLAKCLRLAAVAVEEHNDAKLCDWLIALERSKAI